MSLKKTAATFGLAAFVGLGALAVAVHAQDALSPSGSQKASSSDGDLVARVKTALHSDPSLFDKHIRVSMEKGKVVLRGFVESPQALQKAVAAADKVAGDGKVVNNLTIKEGGDGGSG